MPVLSLEQMRDLIVRVMAVSKTSQEAADAIADALVAAEADGLSSHGLSRAPFYADQAISGKVDGHAVPTVTQTAPAALRVDARGGFAYTAIRRGFAQFAPLAEKTGLAALAVANSHHFGAAGYHLEILANQGLAGFAFGNTPAAMAPWGGSVPLLGTNPIAFAVPRRGTSPLVIDMSLSTAARGKIMVAAKKGKDIPLGWALDADGKPTTDPKAALGGTLLPAGGVKGAVLAMMVEIISAAITGSNFAYEASSFFEAKGAPPRVGQFFIALKPEVFCGDTDYQGRLEEFLGRILVQPGTQLPGYLPVREKSRRDGVAVQEELYVDLMKRAGS
jgi:(2R)-3-sulfolactate dehydrogenase (NADP+)